MFGRHNNWGPRPHNAFLSSSPRFSNQSTGTPSSNAVTTGSIATSVAVQPQLNFYQYPRNNSNNANHPIQHNQQSVMIHSSNYTPYQITPDEGHVQRRTNRVQAARATQLTSYQQSDSVSSGLSSSSGLPPWTGQLHLLPLVYRQAVSFAALPNGQLDTSKLYPVLMSSQLSKPVLGQLWSLVNKQTVGVLTVPECTALLALMALAQINRLPQPLQDMSFLHHLQVGTNFPTPVLTLPQLPPTETNEVPCPTHQPQRSSAVKNTQSAPFPSQGPTRVAQFQNYESKNVTQYPLSSIQNQQYHYPPPRHREYPENLPPRFNDTTVVSDTNQYCGGCEACCASEAFQSELEEEEGGTLYIAEDLLYSGGSESGESFQSSSSSSPSHGAAASVDSPKMNWSIPTNKSPRGFNTTSRISNTTSMAFPSTFASNQTQTPPKTVNPKEPEDDFSGFESAVPTNFGALSSASMSSTNNAVGSESAFGVFRFNLGKSNTNDSHLTQSVNAFTNQPDLGLNADLGAQNWTSTNWNTESSKQFDVLPAAAVDRTQTNFTSFSLRATLPPMELKGDSQEDDFADFQDFADFKTSKHPSFTDWSTREATGDVVSSASSFQPKAQNAPDITDKTSYVNTGASLSTSSAPVADKYAVFRDLQLEVSHVDKPLEDLTVSPSLGSQSTLTTIQSSESVIKTSTDEALLSSTFVQVPPNTLRDLTAPFSSRIVSSNNDEVDVFADFQSSQNKSAMIPTAQKLDTLAKSENSTRFEPFADLHIVTSGTDDDGWADFSAPTAFSAPTDLIQPAMDFASTPCQSIGESKLLKDMVPIMSSDIVVFENGETNDKDWPQFSWASDVLTNSAPLNSNLGFVAPSQQTQRPNMSSKTSVVNNNYVVTSQSEPAVITSLNERTLASLNETSVVTSPNESNLNESSGMTSQSDTAVVTSQEDDWADFEDANPEIDDENDQDGSQQKVPDVSSLVWAKTQVSTDGFYDRIKKTILSVEVKKKPVVPAKVIDKQATLSTSVSSESLRAFKSLEFKVEKPATIPLNERYLGLDGESVTNDDSMQKEVWHKLLEQCREILSLALGALTPTLENDRVRSELGSCPEWVNFCCSAVLVYGVALRVMSSYRATNINDDSVNELIKSVDVCWSELKPFFTPEILQSEAFEIETNSQNIPAVATFGAEACGVCLLRVDQSEVSSLTSQSLQTLPSTNHRNSCISYGGRHYHAPCANLWVNKVDLVLPALLVIDVQ